jgi:hypothetical protein
MFEQLFERPHALARQRNGPLVEERLRYLAHCAEQQMAHRTLRCIAIYTLIVAKALRLADRPAELISRAEIGAEATRWADREPKPPNMKAVRMGAIAPVPRVSALFLWFSSMTWLESATSAGGSLES